VSKLDTVAAHIAFVLAVGAFWTISIGWWQPSDQLVAMAAFCALFNVMSIRAGIWKP
jgi:hypothetical protein